MMNILVKFNKYWPQDEFYVVGFAVMSFQEWENLKESIPYLSMKFGSNEFFNGDLDISDFTTINISREEEATLYKFFKFGIDGWGYFPNYKETLWLLLEDILYSGQQHFEGNINDLIKMTYLISGNNHSFDPNKDIWPQLEEYIRKT
jgi:hypothetical protein